MDISRCIYFFSWWKIFLVDFFSVERVNDLNKLYQLSKDLKRDEKKTDRSFIHKKSQTRSCQNSWSCSKSCIHPISIIHSSIFGPKPRPSPSLRKKRVGKLCQLKLEPFDRDEPLGFHWYVLLLLTNDSWRKFSLSGLHYKSLVAILHLY